MTIHDPRAATRHRAPGGHQHRHGGHGWMMIACSTAMLAIAIALVAAGTASPAFLFAVVGCALMAVMMGGISHGDGRK
jgi:hypothetical protein